jgi:predicted ATPase
MYITHLKLKNWRNFRAAEMGLTERTYIIGPNASGKSNLLDVFRFLRDVCKPAGGGLQKAVEDRDGISRLRCLHHRRDSEVRIEVHLASKPDAELPDWRYVLGFKSEGKGAQRPMVSTEQVWKRDRSEPLVNRPQPEDREDPQLLTETYLEQTRANGEFREIADFFGSVTYLHLVPQLLKYGNRISGNRLEGDPFGQAFLERIAKCTVRTRDARLRKISKALTAAVPHFRELRFLRDKDDGNPHLEALYEHHRPNAGWQREEHFSDGTLRLLGILWSLLEGNSLLLIEEPELSLHEAVIEQIPLLIDRIQREAKYRRQIIVSTHSKALLDNPGIDSRGVIVLEPGDEGTQVRPVTDTEAKGLEAGLSVAEVVLPQTKPAGVDQLSLW